MKKKFTKNSDALNRFDVKNLILLLFFNVFTLKDNLVSKENINNYIFTGCQILNKNIFTSINKDKFSISEVWDKEINNKQLYGIESVNEFLHVTDLDIYKKLSS